MNILVYDPFISEETAKQHGVTKVEKETLFEESDFICVHARYTEQTHHIIGKQEIDRMKPTAYFINSARAGLVDYDAPVSYTHLNQSNIEYNRKEQHKRNRNGR